jgi:signal transduction histidine kinase
MRNLALELRPIMLDTLGLEAALRWLAEHHQQLTGTPVEVVGHLTGATLPAEVATACFRVAQEALTNVARHANARHVWIELSQSESGLELVVRDDGVGFDAAALGQAVQRGHLGLEGMHERVHILGGTLAIKTQPGRGTTIRATFPLSDVSEKPAQPAE